MMTNDDQWLKWWFFTDVWYWLFYIQSTMEFYDNLYDVRMVKYYYNLSIVLSDDNIIIIIIMTGLIQCL